MLVFCNINIPHIYTGKNQFLILPRRITLHTLYPASDDAVLEYVAQKYLVIFFCAQVKTQLIGAVTTLQQQEFEKGKDAQKTQTRWSEVTS